MISPAAAELIRRLAGEAILQIRMGCQAYRTGDVLGGELHLSLGQAALLKMQRLLDEPAQKPLRRMALVVMPRDEEAELPGWATRKHNGSAAREYSIARERYHIACLRIAMARNKESVPFEEWDEATMAACRASNAAQTKLTDLCSQMFPQPERAEVWKEYSEHFWPTKATAPFCTRCNGHHEREGDAEEKCQRETQFARADHRRRGGTI